MNKITIGQIGKQFSVEEVEYYSTNTFLEYDMLLVDLDYIWTVNAIIRRGVLLPHIVHKRRSDFNDFVTHRSMPIISFLPEAGQHSGNGWHVKFLGELITESDTDTKSENGNTIEVISQTLFTDFLNKYKEHFSYKTVVISPVSSVIVKNKYKGETLGYYNQNVIFLPQLNPSIAPHQEAFLQDLYEVAKKVCQPVTEAELPTWANAYFLPEEQQIVQKKKELEAQIIALQNEVQQKQVAIREKEKYKTLFTETGKPLEQAVLKLFQDLVLDVQEGRDKLEDGVLRFAGQTAVWEVKGLTGSASLKDSRQLVSWAQDYAGDEEKDTKGIMIVNGYRLEELQGRNQAVFPANVVDHSTRNGNCLITTTQLLGLYFECQAHPERKEEMIQSLFDTIGVYQRFGEWQAFITHIQSTE